VEKALGMANRVAAIISIALLILLLAPQPALYAGSCIYIDVPAVSSQSGSGSTVRVSICSSQGSGVIRIRGVDMIESDTLASIVVAYILAQIYSGKSFSGSDLEIYFERSVHDISGPSAGALLTLAFYRILAGYTMETKISGTGAINLDGSVEAVGGVPQKILALRNIGYRVIFIPISNYIQLGPRINDSFRDLNILPVGNIASLLGVKIPQLMEPQPNITSIIERVSRDHASNMKRLVEQLIDIYMSRVADRNSIYYGSTMAIVNIASSRPPPSGYPEVNLYYLALVSIVQGIVGGDPRAYGGILAERAVESYNRSVDLLRKVFQSIPRSGDPEVYSLYILLLERALDLADYAPAVRSYIVSRDVGAIANMTASLYGRALSISYWVDLLGNISASGYSGAARVDLQGLSRTSRSILEILGVKNITEISSRHYSAISTLIGSPRDPEGLRMLSTIYILYSYLQGYSATLKRSTFSQIPLRGDSTPKAIEEIAGSGYMSINLISASQTARSIYQFSAWALENLARLPTLNRSLDYILTTLPQSAISTSSSASSINMILALYMGSISTPSKISLAGSKETGQASQAIPTQIVSNIYRGGAWILAIVSIIIAISTTIAGYRGIYKK
jgi:ATP-dependent Lon protease